MQSFTWIILLFLLAMVSINSFLPPRLRSAWLLAGTCLFIGWFSWQALLLAILISTLNFLVAGKVRENKGLFYLLLFFNVACIVSANYIVSYQSNLQLQFTQVAFSLKPLILTLGLSFYTLQHIAYIIDCRREAQKHETNFLQFMLCSLYFPKFLSGPLTKHSELKAQLSAQEVNQENMISGFNRLLLGVFKKMVIADRLAPSVHSVFDFANDYSGLTIFSAALLFTIQLYFDFSGYTDMALGVSKMLGINLPENFNLPLRSLSISDFWRRWHISLIRFFTNYIFYPISYRFRKQKQLAASLGIVCTFLLSGIWHGLGLPFMLWAICHLVYLQFELFTKGIRNVNSVLMKAGGWLLMILAVTFSNVFFRSPGSDALITNTEKLFDLKNFFPKDYTVELLAPLAVGGQQWNFFNFYLVLGLTFGFLLFERRINAQSIRTNFSIVYSTVLLLLIFLFGIFSSGEQFIYVQF